MNLIEAIRKSHEQGTKWIKKNDNYWVNIDEENFTSYDVVNCTWDIELFPKREKGLYKDSDDGEIYVTDQSFPEDENITLEVAKVLAPHIKELLK